MPPTPHRNPPPLPFGRQTGRPADLVMRRKPGIVISAAWQQVIMMAALLLATYVLAAIHLGIVARLVFIAGTLAAGAYAIQRSPWQYLTLTLWAWTLTPLARRFVDYYSGFDSVNFMLVTPNLLTLLMLKDVATSRELLRMRESVVGLLLLVPISYGLVVSFFNGAILPGAVAAADWVSPILYYFYIISHWRQIGKAEHEFHGFLMLNGAVVICYGLYQYLNPLPWDVTWVEDSGMSSSIGHPLPEQIRVFGTLNAPGIMAFWVGALLLLCLHFRSLASVFLIPAGAVVLALTLVRSSVGAVVLGLVLAGILGRASTVRVLIFGGVAVVLVLGGLSAVDPEMAQHLTKRFSTVNNLENDPSALAREDMYRQAPGKIAAHPLGFGIGALGRGAVAGQGDMATVDSGILVIYLALGWFGGSVYLAGIGLALMQAILAARTSRSSAGLAFAITAVATTANIAFTSVTGFIAATIWICTAYPAALAIAARRRQEPAGFAR
jgi:hypothetical protein